MKIYDLIKQILIENTQTRNSDKRLIWEVWCREHKASRGQYLGDTYQEGVITQPKFNSATSTESIRRCRQKIQETTPDLHPTDPKIIKLRRIKQATKSTFIYRENVVYENHS